MTKSKILDRVLSEVAESKKSKASTTKHSVYVSGVFEENKNTRKPTKK